MGKGFNNFMCKKFFHPASRDNLKRVWMAEQKAEAEKKKQDELRLQYEKEQDLYNNKAMLHKGENKDKLSLNFMYDPPAGVKKEREKEDGETVRFEWQRKYNAPRESYCKGDSSIQDQPFGIAVRNVRCIKCKKWGHINTDKECPLYGRVLEDKNDSDLSDVKGLSEGMRDGGLMLRNVPSLNHGIFGRNQDPTSANQRLLRPEQDPTEDELLNSLTIKDKKRLLKKLKKMNKKKKKKKEKDKKKSPKSTTDPEALLKEITKGLKVDFVGGNSTDIFGNPSIKVEESQRNGHSNHDKKSQRNGHDSNYEKSHRNERSNDDKKYFMNGKHGRSHSSDKEVHDDRYIKKEKSREGKRADQGHKKFESKGSLCRKNKRNDKDSSIEKYSSRRAQRDSGHRRDRSRSRDGRRRERSSSSDRSSTNERKKARKRKDSSSSSNRSNSRIILKNYRKNRSSSRDKKKKEYQRDRSRSNDKNYDYKKRPKSSSSERSSSRERLKHNKRDRSRNRDTQKTIKRRGQSSSSERTSSRDRKYDNKKKSSSSERSTSRERPKHKRRDRSRSSDMKKTIKRRGKSSSSERSLSRDRRNDRRNRSSSRERRKRDKIRNRSNSRDRNERDRRRGR